MGEQQATGDINNQRGQKAGQMSSNQVPDVVFIHGLTVDAVIGVFDWEQTITQPLRFDIEMTGCQRAAAESDDISHAINYKTVSERVSQLCQSQPTALLERLAEQVAQMILGEFFPDSVTITLHKPTALPQAQSVGVKITRYRQQVLG